MQKPPESSTKQARDRHFRRALFGSHLPRDSIPSVRPTLRKSEGEGREGLNAQTFMVISRVDAERHLGGSRVCLPIIQQQVEVEAKPPSATAIQPINPRADNCEFSPRVRERRRSGATALENCSA